MTAILLFILAGIGEIGGGLFNLALVTRGQTFLLGHYWRYCTCFVRRCCNIPVLPYLWQSLCSLWWGIHRVVYFMGGGALMAKSPII